MLQQIIRMFELAVLPGVPIQFHKEPNSGFGTDVRSIAVGVRTVPIELLSFLYCGQQQYMVMLRINGQSFLLWHNDSAAGVAPKETEAICNMIRSELDAIIDQEEHNLRSRLLVGLAKNSVIPETQPKLTVAAADAMLNQASNGAFATLADLFAAQSKGGQQ